MEQLQNHLGANIAALRKAKGLTQEQLAAKLGISAPAVSKWETGSSCPDITLLCPLARALGTNVDTLLQFEETLSDEQVLEQINAVAEQAFRQDLAGAEQRLQELLRQYPSCTTLQYNAAVVYDTFRMLCPEPDEETRTRWQTRKRALLEEVRCSGNAAYWQVATIQLASLAIAEDEPEKGAALLKELPDHVGDPAPVWVLYDLKCNRPEEALKRAQQQLYKLARQVQTCLITMMNPKLVAGPEQLRKLCATYRAVAQAFHLEDMSDAPMMEVYLHLGNLKEAAACFARYVDVAVGPVAYPDEELFSPGLHYQKRDGVQATSQPMRRMLLKAITEEEQYRPLFADPVFTAALEKLKASI